LNIGKTVSVFISFGTWITRTGRIRCPVVLLLPPYSTILTLPTVGQHRL